MEPTAVPRCAEPADPRRHGSRLKPFALLAAAAARRRRRARWCRRCRRLRRAVVDDDRRSRARAARGGPGARGHRTALSINEIYRRSGPGVVQITSTIPLVDLGSGQFQQASQALGSGFVLDKEGSHRHELPRRRRRDGDRGALLERRHAEGDPRRQRPLDGCRPAQGERERPRPHPARARRLGQVEVGDAVVAIGNPFGLERTVTAGIVSALQRAVKAPNGYSIDHVIQTDAPINHGNSGGPLLNTRGEVIGINSQIETGGSGDGNVGIGFAVPPTPSSPSSRQLLASGKVEHAYLGVSAIEVTPAVANSFRLPVTQGPRDPDGQPPARARPTQV